MVEISPYYKKQFHCPLCKMDFESLAVRSSKINLAQRETDFHPCYRGPNPLHYNIIVCPLCNYANTSKNFDQLLSDEEIQILSVALRLLIDKRQDFTGIRTLENVLQCLDKALNIAALKQEEEDRLAIMFMYKAWTAREANDSDLEEACLNEALDKLYYVFNHHRGSICVFNDVQLPYLIGEINLRLGDPNEAVQWFIKTVNHRDIKTYPQIEKLTRERWGDAREAAVTLEEEFTHESSESAPTDPVAAGAKDIENSDKTGRKTILPSFFNRNKRSETQIRIHSEVISWLNQQIDSDNGDPDLEEALNCCLSAVMAICQDHKMPVHALKSPDHLIDFLRVTIKDN